ncbi:hypothetical protein ATE47_03965 [Chryseobacterium sp. IHB B 17019]|uniref:hypothetical protein n=1 Tax=Chryseobacterium sp. IHB B 17019 TaxID=1721091 RepID=UPI0007222F08|nr:hypothetical protein [Chryseobacterium sp. IHB B 17019]ALR29727.1 hypothetical protein ATE47_03965 [Chryseobacterium sp. IHB B 17019]
MKKIHKKRSWKKMVIDNRQNTISKQRNINDTIVEASEFQEWFAKMGGMIENEDMEKVIDKFKNQ